MGAGFSRRPLPPPSASFRNSHSGYVSAASQYDRPLPNMWASACGAVQAHQGGGFCLVNVHGRQRDVRRTPSVV